MIATIILLFILCINTGINIANKIYNKQENTIIYAIIAFFLMILLYQYAGLFDKFI